MTTRRDILGRISARLAPLYGAREARSIALVAVSELSGLSASALLTDPGAPLEIAELDDICGQLAVRCSMSWDARSSAAARSPCTKGC